MLVDAKPLQSADTYTAARQKLSIGPVPAWVTSCQADYNFTAKPSKIPPQTTPLLWNVQTDVESNATHFHVALRLENMQAVQQQSQWRLEFEPNTQSITLHWIKIRRGTTETDHTNLDKIRLLQREAGLEGFVIDGFFTALLVLEDVRPGDVLEYCFTRETQQRLLPENRFAFFHLPPSVAIGKVLLILHFKESRPMKWKCSGPNFHPVEKREQGMITWRWERENFGVAELEPEIPPWYLPFPWAQVSDCADWGVVARAVINAWDDVVKDSSVNELVEEICSQESEPLLRVERAIRLVQDEFRYLSIKLEHGGHIPTPPDSVARRRFGDCKDLSLLLVQVLRGLGVSAHPVLVSNAMRRTISGLLPAPQVFDHAIVQYEIQGEVRWVDPTIKNQGGGPLKRVLPNYRYGLVLQDSSSELVQPPSASVTPGTYRIRENILLDTTGAFSYVAIVTTAEGSEAENLRQQFAAVPIDEIARQRLQHCANRYGQAQRVEELKHRDDRDTNEFHIAEIYQINGFLRPSAQPGCCDFYLPPNLSNGLLRLPEQHVRRDPFVLPQPASFIHFFDIQGGGFQQASPPKSKIESPLLRFNRQIRAMPGFCTINLTLEILDEVMMGYQHEEYARRVQQVREESSFKITLPLGNSGAGRNRVFGALPSPSKVIWKSPAPPKFTPPVAANAPKNPVQGVSAESAAVAGAPVLKTIDVPKPVEGPSAEPAQRSRHHHRRKKRKSYAMPVVIGLIVLLIIVLVLFASR